MSPTHMGPPFGPLPPPPSDSEQYSPQNQHHRSPATAEIALQTRQYQHQQQRQQKPTPTAFQEPIAHSEEANVSPLPTPRPDSPTLGYLSPISLISPSQPFSPEQIHANQTQKPPNISHGNTLHLQDHIPFAPTSTRFPRKAHTHNDSPAALAVAAQAATPWQKDAEEAQEEEAIPKRPQTLFLADHHPHITAPSPTAPIARPHYINGVSYHEGRSASAHAEGEDVEMQEVEIGNRGDGNGNASGSGMEKMKTKYAQKRRRQNCLIGWSFLVALVGVGAVFGVLVRRANEAYVN